MLRELSDTSAPAAASHAERVEPKLVAANRSQPRTSELLSWINRMARAQFRHRLLVLVALLLTAFECSKLWLARESGVDAFGQNSALASTVYYCFWLALVAGWFRLGGWLDESTQSLFDQLATRRGFDGASCKRLSAIAYFRWLSLLLAAPLLMVAAVATVSVARASELLAIVSNLLLGLTFVQLTAVGVVFAVHALEKLELATARRIWLLACVVPELLRPLLPGLPTLRSLAAAMEHAILRWGLGG